MLVLSPRTVRFATGLTGHPPTAWASGYSSRHKSSASLAFLKRGSEASEADVNQQYSLRTEGRRLTYAIALIGRSVLSTERIFASTRTSPASCLPQVLFTYPRGNRLHSPFRHLGNTVLGGSIRSYLPSGLACAMHSRSWPPQKAEQAPRTNRRFYFGTR